MSSKGRFGVHGGQYIPETLMNAVVELEAAYEHNKKDPEFQAELTQLLNDYAVLCRAHDEGPGRSEDLSEKRGFEPYRRP